MKLTNEQVDTIKAAPSEVTTADLARQYGVSRTYIAALRNGAARIGGYKKQKRLSFEEAEKVREYYRTGDYSQQSLAEFFSISYQQVYRIIHNHTNTTSEKPMAVKIKDRIPRQFLQLTDT
jgi:plasmid maintenance system antidote protein VapI